MPTLGDYLGLILSEFTRARMNADIESVRIARLYAGDPMLRTMPIPHFRLPNIEMDIPVIVSDMDDVGADPTPTVSDLPAIRKSFDTVFIKMLEKDKIKITPTNKKKLKSVLDAEFKKMHRPVDVPVDIGLIAEKLSKISSDLIRKFGYHSGTDGDLLSKKFNAELKEAAISEFGKFYKPLPRLHTLVKTAEIREAGPSENITRIHMKISEEGFELLKEEIEDESYDRLVPE